MGERGDDRKYVCVSQARADQASSEDRRETRPRPYN